MGKKINIFLTGFSGSGKTTIGCKLAKLLNKKFYDTDVIIKRRYKKSINRIFLEDGEKKFRQLEEAVIINLINDKGQNKVIALGGGAYQKRKIRSMVRNNGIVIYLSCSQREIYKRMKNKNDRPLLSTKPNSKDTKSEVLKKKIKTLLDKRINNYRKADVIVSTTGKTVNQIVKLLKIKTEKIYAGN